MDPWTAYRYYAPGQLTDARLIDALRRAGLPLAEIRSVLADRGPERLAAWAGHVRADAVRRQEALAQARALLTDHQATGRTAMTHLHCAGRTDVGHVRENNEDAFVTGERLVAVADGLGGHAGGELASALATGVLTAGFTGRSHVLTRALGVSPGVPVDAVRRPVAPGDVLVLCTDGLTNHVTDDELAALALSTADPQATADALVELALSRGGEDNVSVVVAEVRAR